MKKHEVLSFIVLTIILLMIISVASGCSLTDQKLDINKIYKKDIQLEINGEQFKGFAVPKTSKSYVINIKTEGKINMLQLKSCSRDDHLRNPSGGFFKSGKKFEYVYTPLNDLENNSTCPLEIGSYEESKGRNAWATIYFQNINHNLIAKTKCSGRELFKLKSTSVCQGSVGSIQKIIFNEKVKVKPSEKCNVLKTKDEKTYTYLMPLGECIFHFGNKNFDFHTHVTLGYDGILVR